MFNLQVVSTAIGFLASAAERSNYKYLFDKQETLKSICENVVVPNVEFRGELWDYEILVVVLIIIYMSLLEVDTVYPRFYIWGLLEIKIHPSTC